MILRATSRLVILAMLALFCGGLYAGTTGKIVGQIVDKDTGEPLIGANVIIDGQPLGSTTDVEGSYLILNVPPGRYTLVAQYIGYQDKRVEGVQVNVDLTTRQKFEMSSATIEFGDEIVVQANRELLTKDLTSSEARVSSEKIENLPVEEIDDVLAIQSGITRDASGNFHIRGGRSSEIGYQLNGISISDGFDKSRGLEIENESVQELQVISGTFNAEYGNAMSGIINIVTKEGGSDFHGSLKSFVGDFLSSDDFSFYNIDDREAANYSMQGTLSGPLPGFKDKVRFFATGRYSYQDGHLYGINLVQTDGSVNITDVPFPSTNNAADTDEFLRSFPATAMNYRDLRTGQAKLTWQAMPTLKFNLEGLASLEEFRDYSHEYRLTPTGDVTKFNDTYSLSFIANHTLSNTTFYTLNFAYQNREFNEYLFEDPFDSRYQDPALFAFSGFRTGGTNNKRFNRTTEAMIGRFDISSQVHKAHLVKMGVEANLTELFFEDYTLIPAVDPATGLQLTPFRPAIPDPTSPTFNSYTENPIQFAAYIQDKIEFESVIINAGVRFDYFNSQGRVLADQRDPNIFLPINPANQALTLEERQAIWYKDAEAKYQFSPRLGIAYPISERGVIHFSFGSFLQIPEYRFLYQNPDFKLTQSSGIQGPFGNANLDAESTVLYEIGLQQQLGEDLKVDVTGFYRDIRDWVTTSAPFATYQAGTNYVIFTNRDYANVRGITVNFAKRLSNNYQFDISYQFQIAEGTNSNPEEEFFQINANNQPTVSLAPLDYDQTHTLNANMYYGGDSWGTTALARFNTGLPYTPTTDFDEATVIGVNATTDTPKNSRRTPNNFVVDLRAHKDINISPLRFKLFARVFNLFDKRNELDVFDDTGRATVTTRTALGENALFPSLFFVRPDYFDQPREVQMGVELHF
ncbi:MAG: TonB-dependent receptor [Calditrichia bacterium]